MIKNMIKEKPSCGDSSLADDAHWNEKVVIVTRFGIVTRMQSVTTWVVRDV